MSRSGCCQALVGALGIRSAFVPLEMCPGGGAGLGAAEASLGPDRTPWPLGPGFFQPLHLQGLCVARHDAQDFVDVGALRIVDDQVNQIAGMPSPLTD